MEPKIADIFARLIVAGRRGNIMQMNDMPEMPKERTKAAISAVLHKGMFTKIEKSDSKPKGFALNPHPLFWMGADLFPSNEVSRLRPEDRKRLVDDGIALLESGINPMPYRVTTFGVMHCVERKLDDGTVISGGEVLFIRCQTVKRNRADPERPDLVLPDGLDEAISIDLFIGHLKRVYSSQNADPHGFRYCAGRAYLGIGDEPMGIHYRLCADGMTERAQQHAKYEIEDAAVIVIASLALLSQQRSIIRSNLEPPSYTLRNSISNRRNPLKPMVRIDLSAYQYRYPFDHAAYPTGGQKSPHNRRGHVRHLRDGRVTEIKAMKIRGGAPKPRIYVVGHQNPHQWPDREDCCEPCEPAKDRQPNGDQEQAAD